MVDLSQLRRLFPRASKSFIESNTDPGLQNPESKSTPGTTLDKILQRKKKSIGRAHVCLTAFTVRPRDPDNIIGGAKALIDGLKKLKLIDDDDPYTIELEVKQRHVTHFDMEKTLVEIIYK